VLAQMHDYAKRTPDWMAVHDIPYCDIYATLSVIKKIHGF